jgi:hypothetical protein
MSNAFYSRQGSYTKGTLARGEIVKSDFDALVTAFDTVEVPITSALKLRSGEDITFNQTDAERALHVVGFSSTGVPELQKSIGLWKGTWATTTTYNIRDIIVDGAAGVNTGNVYIALADHTSGTFATDLAATKWEKMIDIVRAETAVTNATAQAVISTAQAVISTTKATASATSATASEVSNVSSLAAKTASIAARGLSENYRDESYQWGTRAHNSSFTDSASQTGYSAYHWAQEAATSAAVVSGKLIKDTDNDTNIDTEKNADEDIIRFKAAGSEQLHIDSSGVKIINSSGASAYTLPRSTGASGDYLVATDSSGTIAWDTSPSAGLEDFVLLGIDVV